MKIEKASLLEKSPPSSNLVFSILVVSRSAENVTNLLASIASSVHIDLSTIEVLCSWNGSREDESKIAVPKDLNFSIKDRSPYHFATNINLLSSNATSPYICVANDDVKLNPSALFNSLKYLASPNIGLVGSILLFPNGKIQHCGIAFRDDMTPFHIDKGKDLSDSKCIHSPRIVEACTGALFFCKTSLYRAIRMRENFAECGEDICLSIDIAARTGLSIVVPNDVMGEHKEGQTRAKYGKQGTPPKDLEFIRTHASKWRARKRSVSIKTEEKGWIFYRKAEEIQKNSSNCDVRINEDNDNSDIVYFIHYARYDEKKAKGKIAIANFTHYVRGTNAEPLFKSVAHKVDHCIAISESTRRDLLELGVPDSRITVIEIGAAKEFTPKVVVGIVGRIYNDGRKGEDLVKRLAQDIELSRYVELVAMDDCWGVTTIRTDSHHLFYSLIDYLLVPSRVEGGPVPFMEALACGKLSIAPPIGVIPSFPYIGFDVGNYESMRNAIINTAKARIRELKSISSCIVEKNWERWSYEHELLFQNLSRTDAQRKFIKGLERQISKTPRSEISLAYANELYRNGSFSEAIEIYKALISQAIIPESILVANIAMAERKLQMAEQELITREM